MSEKISLDSSEKIYIYKNLDGYSDLLKKRTSNDTCANRNKKEKMYL